MKHLKYKYKCNGLGEFKIRKYPGSIKRLIYSFTFSNVKGKEWINNNESENKMGYFVL